MRWPTRDAQRFLIALLVLALFGGAVIVMTYVAIPADNRDSIIQLIGGVNMLAGVVVGFYFRKGDSEKETDS